MLSFFPFVEITRAKESQIPKSFLFPIHYSGETSECHESFHVDKHIASLQS